MKEPPYSHSLATENLAWHAPIVTPEDRASLLGQQPITIWLTGLSGAGKSTLANNLELALHRRGRACFVLDGDNVRHGLCRDLGFSAHDRSENIRRVAEVAALMNDAGLIVITAFISPFRSDRALARQTIGTRRFTEIYLDTPLAICEQRDPKGLYKKARAGQLPMFTGVDSPYEAPEHPDCTIDTTRLTQQEAVETILRFLTTAHKKTA